MNYQERNFPNRVLRDLWFSGRCWIFGYSGTWLVVTGVAVDRFWTISLIEATGFSESSVTNFPTNTMSYSWRLQPPFAVLYKLWLFLLWRVAVRLILSWGRETALKCTWCPIVQRSSLCWWLLSG